MSAVITLTGPSAAGKSHLERTLQLVHGTAPVRSHTTRAPRAGEVNGLSYDFVDEATFMRLVELDQFIERVEFGGHHYGVTKNNLRLAMQRGRAAVIVVEPHGAVQVRRYCAEHKIPCLSVWLGCSEFDQQARIVERMGFDLAAARPDAARMRKVLVDAGNRLEQAVTAEQVWRRAAAKGLLQEGQPEAYHFQFKSYGSENDEVVADMIVSLIGPLNGMIRAG